MSSYSGADTVADLSIDQWGLVTAAQARSAGLTAQQLKRLTDRGILERVHYGIYRLTRLPYDPRQSLRVAWVALDPDTPAWKRLDEQDRPTGIVSHRSAAELHGLGDLDADLAELTTVRRTRLSIADLRIHVGEFGRSDWVVVEGLPTTTVVRTIGDLAAAGIDGGHLGGVVRDGVERSMVTIDEVEAVLSPYAFAYGHALGDGAAMLRALIVEAGVGEDLVRLADIAKGTEPRFPGVEFDAATRNAIAEVIGSQMVTSRLLQAVAGSPALHGMFDSIRGQFDLGQLTGLMNIQSQAGMRSLLSEQPGLRDAVARMAGLQPNGIADMVTRINADLYPRATTQQIADAIAGANTGKLGRTARHHDATSDFDTPGEDGVSS